MSNPHGSISFEDIVKRIVDDMSNEPFQPRYRNEPYGPVTIGWTERLRTYFWPKPEFDLQATLKRVRELERAGTSIARQSAPWSEDTKRRAVEFANAVLDWGGVPQKAVTPEIVANVIRAAAGGPRDGAPMNSGWTKVAAFATAHLETEDRSNAIWDSRVSWSLVRRLDRILHEAAHPMVPDFLRHIGKVPGRGGSRWSSPLQLRWRHVYGRWEAHFAAAETIRRLRDELNRREVPSIGVGGVAESWRVRTVEMVLFMDGY